MIKSAFNQMDKRMAWEKRLNYGIMLCGEEENDGLIALGGIRFPEVEQRPVFIINFSDFNY